MKFIISYFSPKKDSKSSSFTKVEMATHAYEILNLLIGDIFSAIFLDKCTENFERTNRAQGKSNKFIVHYNRNRLRLAASALFRYTEIYKKRIKFLDIDLSEAEKLNQRLNGHQARDFRHLFEHELSQKTNEPHSPGCTGVVYRKKY